MSGALARTPPTDWPQPRQEVVWRPSAREVRVPGRHVQDGDGHVRDGHDQDEHRAGHERPAGDGDGSGRASSARRAPSARRASSADCDRAAASASTSTLDRRYRLRGDGGRGSVARARHARSRRRSRGGSRKSCAAGCCRRRGVPGQLAALPRPGRRRHELVLALPRCNLRVVRLLPRRARDAVPENGRARRGAGDRRSHPAGAPGRAGAALDRRLHVLGLRAGRGRSRREPLRGASVELSGRSRLRAHGRRLAGYDDGLRPGVHTGLGGRRSCGRLFGRRCCVDLQDHRRRFDARSHGPCRLARAEAGAGLRLRRLESAARSQFRGRRPQRRADDGARRRSDRRRCLRATPARRRRVGRPRSPSSGCRHVPRAAGWSRPARHGARSATWASPFRRRC